MKQEPVSDLVTGTGRVTVRAIAAETGLSIATISRVLNGGGNVASDTRERVRQVVERLGDRAPEPRRRPQARAAARPLVFVRCPYLLTDYFGHIVTSIAETLALHGQGMLLDAGDAVVTSAALRELPRRGDVYGAVLILPPEPRADLEALAARSYPLVVVDPRTAVPRGMVSISAAHFSGSRAITRHLIELGHRRIGVITGPPYWHTRDDRVGGHLAALAEAGVLGDPELMRYGEPAAKTGVWAGGELLDLRPRPTAVACFNDKVAVGVMEAAAAHGLRVPEDLSVTGFDDIDVSRATTPRLTTVRQPLQEMGRTAVTMLMRQLDGHAHEALSMELETRLVVRESTGPVAPAAVGTSLRDQLRDHQGMGALATRRLGRSTVEVTRLGFGGGPLGGLFTPLSEDTAAGALAAAWDGGIRYFDTSPHYGLGQSERRIGGLLSGKPRAQYTLSTKVGRILVPQDPAGRTDEAFQVPATHRRVWDFSRDGVVRSVEDSLSRTGVDRFDMLFLHDAEDHFEAALRDGYPALAELRAQGAVGAIGAGMYDTALLTRLVREADVDVVLLASRYTLLNHSALDDLLPACAERGVSVLAAAVFNSGVLAAPRPPADATYDYHPAPPELLRRVHRIADVCEAHGVTLPQAAMAFPLLHPVVAGVVVGMRSAAEVRSNLASFSAGAPAALWSDLGAEGLVDERAIRFT